MSQLQVNRINDASGGVLAPISSVMRNRIINGAMVIDQRNAGASVTATNNTYCLDRWNMNSSVGGSYYTVQQNAGSVTPPVGFTNYLGVTSVNTISVSGTDSFTINQRIEGFNLADLGWGTANAKTITLSAWVRSSLTGTFGGAISNAALDRSYPFSYSIPVANTWTQISVTIAGDTTGTWSATNTTGMFVWFGLGVGSTFSGTAGAWAGAGYRSATGATSVVGTNGATFYITGVQLEVGTQATSFEYRQYGTELALCQRYFEKSYNQGTALGTNTFLGAYTFGGSSEGNGNSIVPISYSVKRVAPTLTGYLSAGTSGSWNYERSGTSGTGTITFDQTSDRESRAYIAVGANWVVTFVYGHWTASAEL